MSGSFFGSLIASGRWPSRRELEMHPEAGVADHIWTLDEIIALMGQMKPRHFIGSVALLIAFYPLSIGPVIWIRTRGQILNPPLHSIVGSFYDPLYIAGERFPPLGSALD